ncbi:polyprenyl synthetase family protein [Kitasatospora purpeofusca]|uniref:polyprenyl synthetase family protein n=1 Tax=Kitasatospora purpeofusca TaxID=67352 RepID=UPI0036A8C15D
MTTIAHTLPPHTPSPNAQSPNPQPPHLPSQHSLAAGTTRRARELTEPLLREAVALLEPWTAMMSSYHLGWCAADGSPVELDSGKAVRPALAVLAAEAVGAPAEAALPGAAAAELIHNFSLIHDDIMDGDEERRRRPTVWKEFGVSGAILAGDALQVLAFDLLLAKGGPHGPAAAGHLAVALRELVEGQACDIRFSERPWSGPGTVTVAEYQAMAMAKTGALLAGASAMGAVLGGADRPLVHALAEAAGQLGLAFQCVDDILGIWGDPAVTGKPVRGDLRERKKSLPVVAASAASGTVARRLAELLADGRAPAGEEEAEKVLLEAAALIEEGGGRRACEREAEQALARARASLDLVPMPAGVRAQYTALADSFVSRVM